MEQVKRGPGRPKRKQPEEENFVDSVRRHAAEDKEVKAQTAVVEKWYEVHGEKVRFCVRKKNGNIFKRYWGKTAKIKDRLAALQKQGVVHFGDRY